MDLDEVTIQLNYLVRRYAKNQGQRAELEHAGKVFICQLVEQDPFIERKEAISLTHSYLHTMSNKEQKGVYTFLKTDTARSIDKYNPEVDIKKYNSKEFLFATIKNKFGSRWIKKINESDDTKTIIKFIIKTAIEDIGGINKQDIPIKANSYFFADIGLYNFLWTFFDGSPSKAIRESYENQFVPWEFNRVQDNFWKGKEGQENINWALEWFANKYKLLTAEDCRKIKYDDFAAEGLTYMLKEGFEHKHFLALQRLFPDLAPWKMSKTNMNFFTKKENRHAALKSYLIEKGVGDISDMTIEEIHDTEFRNVFGKTKISNHGLRGLLRPYKGSTYRLGMDLFPQLKPWSFTGAKEPWKENIEDKAAEAIRWLFESYLGIEKDEIPSYATNKLFWAVGFSGILTNRRLGFSSSGYEAVNNAYPGYFSAKDFAKRNIIYLDKFS